MTMGKKGDLLRAQKAQKAVYTFTGEQLRKRDEAMKEVQDVFHLPKTRPC